MYNVANYNTHLMNMDSGIDLVNLSRLQGAPKMPVYDSQFLRYDNSVYFRNILNAKPFVAKYSIYRGGIIAEKQLTHSSL